MRGESVESLRDCIDARWAVVQPVVYPDLLDGWQMRPTGGLDLLTPREVTDFLLSMEPYQGEPPLFVINDDGVLPCDRTPPNASGAPKRYRFFEEGGGVRLETIVEMAALSRLRHEFGWPRAHLIVESPDVLVSESGGMFGRDALDIIALEQPCEVLTARMTVAAARARVAGEVKAIATQLDGLLRGCRAARGVQRADTTRASTASAAHSTHSGRGCSWP